MISQLILLLGAETTGWKVDMPNALTSELRIVEVPSQTPSTVERHVRPSRPFQKFVTIISCLDIFPNKNDGQEQVEEQEPVSIS